MIRGSLGRKTIDTKREMSFDKAPSESENDVSPTASVDSSEMGLGSVSMDDGEMLQSSYLGRQLLRRRPGYL